MKKFLISLVLVLATVFLGSFNQSFAQRQIFKELDVSVSQNLSTDFGDFSIYNEYQPIFGSSLAVGFGKSAKSSYYFRYTYSQSSARMKLGTVWSLEYKNPGMFIFSNNDLDMHSFVIGHNLKLTKDSKIKAFLSTGIGYNLARTGEIEGWNSGDEEMTLLVPKNYYSGLVTEFSILTEIPLNKTIDIFTNVGFDLLFQDYYIIRKYKLSTFFTLNVGINANL